MEPKTQYARSGDVSIAYQVIGEGPFDLVFVPGWVSNLDLHWQNPLSTSFFHRLASFSRLILFDKRGTGLSDPFVGVPTLEQRMDDVRVVMDAAGSERAAIFGLSEGGPMSILFAATYPDRATHLVLCGTGPKMAWAPDYPWGWPDDGVAQFARFVDRWGEGASVELLAPDYADVEQAREQFGQFERTGASPSMARALIEALWQIDVRPVLSAIHVPTLIIHRTDELALPVGGARYMAGMIPGARLVEQPGRDHVPWLGDSGGLLDEVERFLTGTSGGAEPDRVLATLLFTDIVGSTERATALGDRRWRETLDRHDDIVRAQLASFRGQEVDKAGDGFLAHFDRPAAAIRCARSITDAVLPLGITIRAGLHTGECELRRDGLGGIAVHIGARVAAKADSNEVLVSRTVKDLVAGSGIDFVDRGVHTLKGVDGEWQLFAVNG
jgi:pimeloyl-ACP methyl ester carboxylesterase